MTHALHVFAAGLLLPLGFLLADPTPAPTTPATPASSQAALDNSLVSIKAPTQAAIGELVRLESLGGAVNTSWAIVPESADFELVEAGKRAMFSARSPGTWTIVLAGSSGSKVEIATATIRVASGPGPLPPPGPTPPGPTPPGPTPPGPTPPGPTPPDPTPDNTTAALIDRWADAVKSPALAADRKSLADAFDRVAAQISAGVLRSSNEIQVATRIENRKALGANVTAWERFFVTDLAGHLDKLEAAGNVDWGQVWRDIAEGLRR